MQKLFAQSFYPENTQESPEMQIIVPQLEAIDGAIHQAAPEWPVEKISRVDLAILRLAIYELTIEKKEPPKVVIDEAVELAKEFGNPTSPGFINGALGAVLKETYDV